MSDASADPLSGQLLFVLLAAGLLTTPASLLVLGLYRRAVTRRMRTRGFEAADPTSIPSATTAPGSEAPAIALVEANRAPALGPVGANLLHRALRAPWELAARYAAGGLAYAAVMTAAWSWASGTEGGPLRAATLMIYFSFPVIVTALLVATPGRGVALGALGGYVALAVAPSALALARNPSVTPGSLASLWAILILPSLLLSLAVANARVRSIGPLVFLLLALALAGSQAALDLLREERGQRVAVDIPLRFGLGGAAAFFVTASAGLILVGGVGALLILWVRRVYDAKRTSDQAILHHAIWCLSASAQALTLLPGGRAWLLAAPASLFARWATIRALSSVRRGSPRAAGRKSPLLLLRVFALSKRGERQFAAVERHWRHVGSIHLITGPDLATRTIEPYELIEFATGRLRRLVVDGPEAIERRLSALDLAPDPDGRCRVNELLCQEDTWRPTLSRLVRVSDAVLMDLRAFGAVHEGCRHELQELVAHVPLHHVVLLVDATTDLPFLERALAEASLRAPADSPNRGLSRPADVTLLRARRGAAHLPQLLRCLCAAASERA